MLIECTLIRGPNRVDPHEGTLVSLPNYDATGDLILSETHYRFAPREDDPRHCCEVADTAHAGMLLAVRHTYRQASALSEAEKADIANRPNTVVFRDPKPRQGRHPAPSRPELAAVETEPEVEPPIEDLTPARLEPEGPLDRVWLEQANVTDIQMHCQGLTIDELNELEEWEIEHKERQGVFNAIRSELKLRQEHAGDDGPTAATA